MVLFLCSVVLTAEGEIYTFGHRVVTPRKISLAGSRDTARAAALAPLPAAAAGPASSTGNTQQVTLAASGVAAGAAAGAAGDSGGLSAELSAVLGSSPSSSTWVGWPPQSSSSSSTGGSGGAVAAGVGPVAAEVKFHRDQVDVSRPVAVAIAAGVAHTSCLTRTGVVLTWCSQQLQPEIQVGLSGRFSFGPIHCGMRVTCCMLMYKRKATSVGSCSDQIVLPCSC
jgi:hypothetical protein